MDEILTKLERNKVNRYKDVHKSKARIHTWLAWQNPPGLPMGTSIKKNLFDTNKELCLLFIEWIKKLFD